MDTIQPTPTSPGKGEGVTSTSSNPTLPSTSAQQPSSSASSAPLITVPDSISNSVVASPPASAGTTYMPPIDTLSPLGDINKNRGGDEDQLKVKDAPKNNESNASGAQVTNASGSSSPPSYPSGSVHENQKPSSQWAIKPGHDGDIPKDSKEGQGDDKESTNIQAEELSSSQAQPQLQLQLQHPSRPASIIGSSHPDSLNTNASVNTGLQIEPRDEPQLSQQGKDVLQPLHLPQQNTLNVESNGQVDSSSLTPALVPMPSTHPMPTSLSGTAALVIGDSSVTGTPTGSSLDPSRSLNVNDALGYLDEVKNRFQTKPDVYNHFLEIMKDFKSKRIDTPRVIERVSLLFAGHPALIQGFNTFLPPGYRIECMTDREQGGSTIRVTTPHGTIVQSAGNAGFGEAKTQDSSLHPPSQPWIIEGLKDAKELLKDDNIQKNEVVDERVKIKMEESKRSRPEAGSDMDVQLTEEQLQQQSRAVHLLAPQQLPQIHHPMSIMSSNAASASPSPAPPPSSSHPAATLHRSMSATPAGGGNANAVLGLTPTFVPQPSSAGSVFGTGGGLDPARSLNVNDALGYLDEVKNKFQNNPDVYNHFLEIMKDFKSQRIDTPGVIERVSLLFAGHPALIQGFNTFLPPGYRIDCMTDPEDGANSMIRVTTPQGTMMQSAKGVKPGVIVSSGEGDLSGSGVPHPHIHIASLPTALATTGPDGAMIPGAHLFAAASGSAAVFTPGPHPSELQPTEQAMEYVNRIKERYADDPASYHSFLDLLQKYNSNPEEVWQRIVDLFSQAPDLLEDFKMFLPKDGIGLGGAGAGGIAGGEQAHLMKMFTQGVEAVQAQMTAQQTAHDGPTKSRRKDKDRGDGIKEDKEKAQGQSQGASSTTAITMSPQKRKRKPVEKDTNTKATAGSGTSAGGLGPSKVKKPKHHHHEASPSIAYREHEMSGGPPYTNVYQQSRPQPQHTHFHPDAFVQAQYHIPTQPHPQFRTQLESQVHQDTTFFDRVRQFLDNRETYDEFLKLLNLFTQELINLRTLVFQAKSFLGETDLMAQFREMVGWEERSGGGGNSGMGTSNEDKTAVGQVVKPNKVDLSIRYGPSYRRLPPSETQVVCSGRDAFCNSVLNDEWVSHPSWVSEDSGFIAHKKNVYEEALHRSEEERHEYDFYLEAMSKTISVLESPHTKILQMSESDRMNYKFKPNWNGTLKTIHQRLLKKVYGREAGMEVVQAIQDNPALAIPIVFQRLKQKEEEWKRAQREWNKVWREVDARNYWKSLDHQGVTFKTNDKKTITAKAFVTNIELVRQQQMMKRASLIDPTFGRGPPEITFSVGAQTESTTNATTSHPRPRYQLAYTIEDVSVLQDAVKLVLSFLDRTHGTISVYDRKKIEQFMRCFVPLFFMYYQREFDSAFAMATGGADLEDIMAGDGISNGFADEDGGGGPSGTVAGSTRSKNGKRVSGDIRKKVLKATQSQSQSQSQNSLLQAPLEKSTRRTRSVASASASVSASAPPSAPGSRAPSPPASGGDVEMRDISSAAGIKKLLSAAGGISTGASAPSGKLLNNASTGFQPPTSGPRKPNPRRGLFFANTNLYVLLRLLHLLYSRLLLCKQLGAELAEAEKAANVLRQQQGTDNSTASPPVPGTLPDTPAFAFAITTPAFTTMNNVELAASPAVGAEHFYGHLLECCERLFDNQLDQATFEDTARYMFGMKAYNVFTVDKVVGAIIKQIQLIISDNKAKELVQLLQKERDNPSMSLQDQNSYREKAGAIVGSDEHLYRIICIPDSRTFTIQLLGKDDPKDEDNVAMIERWEAYIDAFQHDVDSSAPPPRGRYPFLRRILRNDKPASVNMLFTRNSMETRICMRTYRMFFVSHTEDVLYWRYPKGALQEYKTVADKRVQQRSRWVETFDKDGWKRKLA